MAINVNVDVMWGNVKVTAIFPIFSVVSDLGVLNLLPGNVADVWDKKLFGGARVETNNTIMIAFGCMGKSATGRFVGLYRLA